MSHADQGPGVEEERIRVAGLEAPAEILVDHWGIPHIRAGSERDLFFAQGFNAARDRLWGIDLWRKRGLGLLAADFGPGYLAQDRAARLFLYDGDMTAEWAAYGPGAEAVCERFTAGINAFIDLAEREPERLPPEFGMLGTKPQRWAPDEVVRVRSHGLTRNALSEVLRAVILARADLATDLLRRNLEPALTPRVAEGLDLCAISVDVLDVFKLATAPVTFTPERLRATLDEAWAWTKVTDLGDVVRGLDQGSNNWVVHGSLTDTGRPILASDPHRAHAIPSLRYLVHLTAPGLDLIGAGEPVIPGVSLGHNGTVAFGLTIFGADQEDLYVYEMGGDCYRYGEGWEAMRVVEERFAVKGAPDQVLALKFTRHGPVIFEDPSRSLAYAVRSVWSEPGTAAYMASIASMRARNLDGFRAAMRGWGAPSANQVYADTTGRIAWLPVGVTPVRPGWDGLTPVPGDGRYEWAGFLDPGALPCIVNPPCGFIATANEMNLPADWDHARHPVGYEWVERSRATRIHEALAATKPHALASSCALQTDDVSVPARRLLAVLSPLRAESANAGAAEALGLLRGWDARLSAGSAAAALFEVWWTRHLKPALLARLVEDESLRKHLAPGDVESILALVERPDGRLGDDPSRARDGLLIGSLRDAFRDCAARMGEPGSWAWGRLHQGYFEHALTPLADPGNVALDVGPLAKGGSSSTPMHAGYRPSDFRVVAGASVRIVIDVGNWDSSLCINAPGQSGDPRSPHYGDLAPAWAAGTYVPLLYSRDAVDGAAQRRIKLLPEGRPDERTDSSASG